MKMFIIMFFGLSPLLLSAQEVPTIVNGEDYKAEKLSPFLRNLHDSNDYIVTFRLKLTDKEDERSDYFILGKNDDKLSAYTYLQKYNELQSLDLSPETLQLCWKTFIQNDLLTMKNEIDIANFCAAKYQIFDSYIYEFLILSKDKMKKLSYYNPEYYDIACYGIAERQKIINSVSVIALALNK